MSERDRSADIENAQGCMASWEAASWADSRVQGSSVRAHRSRLFLYDLDVVYRLPVCVLTTAAFTHQFEDDRLRELAGKRLWTEEDLDQLARRTASDFDERLSISDHETADEIVFGLCESMGLSDSLWVKMRDRIGDGHVLGVIRKKSGSYHIWDTSPEQLFVKMYVAAMAEQLGIRDPDTYSTDSPNHILKGRLSRYHHSTFGPMRTYLFSPIGQ